MKTINDYRVKEIKVCVGMCVCLLILINLRWRSTVSSGRKPFPVRHLAPGAASVS